MKIGIHNSCSVAGGGSAVFIWKITYSVGEGEKTPESEYEFETFPI